MSSSDLWMRDVLANYGFIIILLIGLLLWIGRKWPKFRENNYKAHLLGFEAECADLAISYKEELFKSLGDIVSHDEILRSMGCIRILEIGVKTGENVQFYPEGTHFIGVDWNVKLGEYLVKGNRSWQFSHVIIERLIVGDGSCLKDIPTGYVDVAVTSRSLCCVKSVTSTLREIHRVLAPGGKYYFMEHVPDSEGTLLRWLQEILTRSAIWPFLFGDCRLDVDICAELKTIEFQEVTWTVITLEGCVSQPIHLFLSGQHVIGSAIR